MLRLIIIAIVRETVDTKERLRVIHTIADCTWVIGLYG